MNFGLQLAAGRIDGVDVGVDLPAPGLLLGSPEFQRR
jgi:hypothetical protein